jgi:hypothetical protein
MNEFALKDLVPLIALVIGWLLSETSNGFKRTDEKRRRLSRGLATCYNLQSVLRRAHQSNLHLGGLSDDPPTKEAFRNRVAFNFSNSGSLLEAELDELVEVYREYIPLRATNAAFLRDAVFTYGRISLKSSAQKPAAYEATSTALLNSFASLTDACDQLARHLAIRIGLITYLRVRFLPKPTLKATKSQKEQLIENYSKISSILYEVLQENENGSLPKTKAPTTNDGKVEQQTQDKQE